MMNTRRPVFPSRPHALYAQHGYSPAIQSGDLLFVSGMVGAREDGTPEPNLKSQIQLAFENLRGVLEAASCAFDDVVDLTMFLVDPEASAGLAIEALAKAFPGDAKPNATAVGVNWLAGFQFEIKVIARIPRK
jgi:enamine deaminase RidA (YjgF/YER057c/UK114 family)